MKHNTVSSHNGLQSAACSTMQHPSGYKHSFVYYTKTTAEVW